MIGKWCLAILIHFSRSRSFLGSVQYSKGLEDKQFKMLEHNNPVSKYKANFDKCNNVWNREMVTELFSRSRWKCEFQKSCIYLCATKNGDFWTYWPPGRNLWVTVPQPWLNESQSKAAQGSLWHWGWHCTLWVAPGEPQEPSEGLLPPPLLVVPQQMELGIPDAENQTHTLAEESC